jgi:hypothetical protein
MATVNTTTQEETTVGRFYGEDEGDMPYEFWEANLQRAIRGRRGQAFLRYLKRALEALPEPRLIEGGLYHRTTEDENAFPPETEMACALGAVLRLRLLEGGEVVTWKPRYPKRHPREGVVTYKTLAALDTGLPLGDDDLEGDEHAHWVANTCDVAENLAWHIGYLNDEQWEGLTPERRFQQMLAWIDEHLRGEVAA